MAVSLTQLKKAGITPKNLKRIFTAKEEDRLPAHRRLYDSLRCKTNDGIQQNLRDYRIYQAIDAAFDSAFAQTTPMLVRGIVERMNKENLSQKQVLELCAKAQIPFTDLFCRDKDAKTETGWGEWRYQGPPTFFNVRVPIVKVYVISRLASLFNARNQDPLLNYLPRVDTARNRLQAEAITSLMSKSVEDLGEITVFRDAILHALLYSIAVVFTQETWYVEEQLDDDGKPVVVKEGLRHIVPRPERTFYDLRHPVTTFNTNSGCEYAAFWRLQTYGEISANPMYWNKKAIPFGTQWWDTKYAGNFFQEIYPCRMFPQIAGGLETTDRETRAAYYTTDMADKAVFLTNFFWKLVPSDWGLGGYNYPIWFRFEIASDNTVMWCEPVPYNPVLVMPYDSDGGRSRNASLALEIIPWQEIYGNALSQLLFTAKQNLANINFYDTEVLTQDTIREVTNAGEQQLRGIVMVPFNSQEMRRRVGPGGIEKSIHSMTLTRGSTVELTNVLGVITTMLERQLGMSSQEIGQAASHEQTVPEIELTKNATQSRLAFTGSFVDEYMSAWKQQLWDAFQVYGDKDFEAQVSFKSSQLTEILKELGFDVLDEPHSRPEDMVTVTGKVKNIELTSFARLSNDTERDVDDKNAGIIMQAVTAIANNQILGPAVGADPLLRLMSRAVQYLTGEQDFEVKREAVSPEQQQAQQAQQQQLMQEVQKLAQQAVEQMAPQIVQTSVEQSLKVAGEQIAKPASEAIKSEQEAIVELQQHQKELTALVTKIEQFMQVMQQVKNAPPQPMQPQVPVTA